MSSSASNRFQYMTSKLTDMTELQRFRPCHTRTMRLILFYTNIKVSNAVNDGYVSVSESGQVRQLSSTYYTVAGVNLSFSYWSQQ
jgi:hypothetical protein